MLSQLDFARTLIDTFDKSSVELFRSFLAKHGRVAKWIISSDFALKDPQRPIDCMSFTLLPYDALPDDIKADVNASLPKDFKETKSLDEDAINWLRDDRRFHIVVTLEKGRVVFANGASSTKQIDVAREHIDQTLAALEGTEHKEALARFKSLKQDAKANGFNVGLLSNIWVLGAIYAAITAILHRERPSEMIGWFPDRDTMTNYCNRVWTDYTFWPVHGLCDALDLDMQKVFLSVGAPDTSGPKEIMWFDYMIRSADWFAGAIASWDRNNNSLPPHHDKYRQMIEDVVADATNTVLLHGTIDGTQATFKRVVISRSAF